jgi:CheY-like chemotaxis protein
MMGGDIAVESTAGEGSVFKFDVVFDITEKQAIKHTDLNFPDLAGKHMLVVDDIEINRFIIVSLLDETGIDITEAENGAEAVDKIHASDEGFFDIVLLDTRMPVMDGYEAARRIRELPRKDVKSMPIISMSANAFRDDIEAALNAGMTDYVLKPVVLERLAFVLTEYL